MFDKSRPLLFLAPLAGYTDLPFRSVAKRFGADVTVSEMISSNALVHQSAKSLKMVRKTEIETPYAVQLSGNDSVIMTQAVEILNEEEGIDIIDLNAGCPAPKIVKNSCGSALLKDLRRFELIASTIKKASRKKYFSIKTRLGFIEKQPVEIAKAAEASGADYLVVHARTRSDGYKKERIDYDSLIKVKQAVSIPVVANGEITSQQIALEVLNHTGCDGLMIGRGAVGRPWIFQEIKDGVAEVPIEVKKAVVLEHFHQMLLHHGSFGVSIFRKHLHTYSKGIPGASTFRDKVNRTEEETVVRELIDEFFI